MEPENYRAINIVKYHSEWSVTGLKKVTKFPEKHLHEGILLWNNVSEQRFSLSRVKLFFVPPVYSVALIISKTKTRKKIFFN